jgi:hypothetical protein
LHPEADALGLSGDSAMTINYILALGVIIASSMFGIGACLISRATAAQESTDIENNAKLFAEAKEIKPLLKGLVSMEDARCLNANNNQCIPDNSISDAFSLPYVLHGVVINVTWTQIEPRAGEFTF